MVVRRTIHHLKSRPRDERAAVAGFIALGVVGVLLIGWAISFLAHLQGLSDSAATDIATSSVQLFPSDTTVPLEDSLYQ